MTKIRKLFFLIFLIPILVTGCGTSGDGKSSSSFGSFSPFGSSSSPKKIQDINIYVGTSGLSAEFAKSAPPPKVFEDSSFPILLKIRNGGAYSISKDRQGAGDLGVVVSIGREKDYIPNLIFEKDNRLSLGAKDNEAFFYIGGKTQINQKGDEIVVSINAKTGKLDPQSEQKSSTITATLCYPYKTILDTTVCIDPDIAGIRPGKKVCNVKDFTFNSGQGAPIAVTRIEPQMIPEGDIIKPQFLVFIENRGKGTPVNIVGYHNACRESDFASKSTWNIAHINAYTSGPQGQNQLECSPSEQSIDQKTGFVRLRDKKTWVRCTFTKGVKEIKRTDDAYTSPLRIEVDYGYVQTVSTNFFIQKPLKY